MSAADWGVAASVAAVVVAIIALAVALKGVRDQLRTATFLAYTERYGKTMAALPYAARRPGSGYRLDKVEMEERINVQSAFRDYFNLCSEELFLHSIGRIDAKTWQIWRLGIRQVMEFPCYEEVWKELGPEYEYYREFVRFMTDLRASSGAGDAPVSIPASGRRTKSIGRS
jgi:hypothetical protein